MFCVSHKEEQTLFRCTFRVVQGQMNFFDSLIDLLGLFDAVDQYTLAALVSISGSMTAYARFTQNEIQSVFVVMKELTSSAESKLKCISKLVFD